MFVTEALPPRLPRPHEKGVAGPSRVHLPAHLGRRLLTAVGVLFGLFLIGSAVAFAALTRDLPDVSEFARTPLALTTKVYARDGTTLLHEFALEQREAIRYDQLPPSLIQAITSAEDKTFFTNPGVDAGGVLRALLSRLRNQPQVVGGSTITQQLVKIRLVGNEQSFTRKIREAYLAMLVSRTYSKEQIMELYVNQIYYGAQAYGVKTAARVYFGVTDLSKLTLSQSALLAGLPQGPSILDPSQEQNLVRAKARRTYVLSEMEQNGHITHDQFLKSDAEEITLVPRVVKIDKAPHFVLQVRNQLAGIVGSEAQVLRGGYNVISTLDASWQNEADTQVKAHIAELRSRNVNNAALVSLDPRTGEVYAYVGSADFAASTPQTQGQFDVAGTGLRQPGSSFKMFTYLTALSQKATPSTVVMDVPTDFGGGYKPANADGQFHGPITMRQALRESRNIPAIKFLAQYAGVDKTIETAQLLGITADLKSANAGLSLTLGAVPVKLIDMTRAYGVLANKGAAVPVVFITSVKDSAGKTVYTFNPNGTKRRAITEDLAWLMTNMLKDTTNPDTSFIFGPWTNIGRPAALKTGTTDDFKDVYAVGYTPQLVTGVWMGNSDGSSMSSKDFSSAMGPGQLWRDYMKFVHTTLPILDWPRPAGLADVEVVVAPGSKGGYGSGLKADNKAPFRSTEHFLVSTQPKTDDSVVEACPTFPPAPTPTPNASAKATPTPAPTATPAPSPKGRLNIREDGPASWQQANAAWIKEALKGTYNYGRYPWESLLADGTPCPTFPPTPSVTPTPSPTPTGTSSPTLSPTSAPRLTPLPTGTPFVPTPAPTVAPLPVATPPRATLTPVPTR